MLSKLFPEKERNCIDQCVCRLHQLHLLNLAIWIRCHDSESLRHVSRQHLQNSDMRYTIEPTKVELNLGGGSAIMRAIAVLLLLFPGIAHAGILITRSDKGLQFGEAFAVVVNGKDKVLSVGGQPKVAGPAGKLASMHLTGMILKDASANALALYDTGNVTYILPDGLGKNGTGDGAALWRTAKLAWKKAANDKSPTDVPVAAFVGFLPEGAEELANLCLDNQALGLLGGKGNVFKTQIDWIAAAVRAYPGNAAMAPLQKFVERAMRQRYEQFETGTAPASVLQEALQLADLSQAIYPNVPEQVELRKVLRDRKAWLNLKTAILLAFAAAEDWDAFLLADRDFEKYEQAFPEMLAKHKDALKRSLEFHSRAGEARQRDGEYGAAFREFRLASLRNPSDPILEQKVRMAWIEYSSQVASEHQRDRKQLKLSERDAITQALDFATRYKDLNKLDEAMKSVQEAERVDPESLPVLLKKAEVLGAQRRYSDAERTLDEYDKRAVAEERAKAAGLRTDLLFKQREAVESARSEVTKALADSRYYRFRNIALNALRSKNDDPDLLYYAGLASVMIRDTKQSREYLNRYLELSNTLAGDEQRRAKARTLLAAPAAAAEADRGDSSWMSGKKLPKSVYYDPISLAFVPKVDHIEASNKLKVSYEWNGERLRSIIPTFEKPDRATGERRISFAYEDRVPQIASVAYEAGARPPSGSDPDELLKSSLVVLLNNPYVDPVAIENLTGDNITLAISGNAFFHPFVWDKVHFFRLVYDDWGRVKQAREIPEPKAPPSNVVLEFEWDRLQLLAVRAYQGVDKRRVKIYERTLLYQDSRLIGEDIRGQGKPSHIKYTYNGNRLVSAECSNDMTLDGRSRKVVFLANSPSTIVN
jgi:hypothetical protein